MSRDISSSWILHLKPNGSTIALGKARRFVNRTRETVEGTTNELSATLDDHCRACHRDSDVRKSLVRGPRALRCEKNPSMSTSYGGGLREVRTDSAPAPRIVVATTPPSPPLARLHLRERMHWAYCRLRIVFTASDVRAGRSSNAYRFRFRLRLSGTQVTRSAGADS